MLSMLLLATVAAASPLEARVVAIDLQRPTGGADWYNRVNVEFESRDERQVRICPRTTSVVAERRVGSGFRPVDRFQADAMMVDGHDYSAACQELTLAPNRDQVVTFIVRSVPGRWEAEDRYSFVVDADSRRFVFVEEARTAGR